MIDTIRNSCFGEIVYHASSHKLFQHPEERPDFVLPAKHGGQGVAYSVANKSLTNAISIEQDGIRSDSSSAISFNAIPEVERGSEKEAAHLGHEPESAGSYIIVDWYGPDDQDNPQNWSTVKKSWIMVSVAILTTALYMASSIFTPAIEELVEDLNTTHVKATLPLTVFVLGYGIGPMLLSPLSEHAPLGRTYIYIITMLLFVLIQIFTALTNTIEKIIGLRLIAGILASPSLSTGGATVGDVFHPSKLYVGLLLWGFAAFCGPSLGPLIGGVLAQLTNWRWTFWFTCIISGVAVAVLFVFLPETNRATLLYRRAKRLRKLTGNDRIRSPFEVSRELHPLSAKQLAIDTLWRPIFIAFFEPMVFFLNLYTAFVYIITNAWFEAFPIVFVELYGFNLIQSGITYLSTITGALIGGMIYLYVVGRIMKAKEPPIERFLIPTMIASFLLPIGLFIFAWGASTHTHWMAPIMGSIFFNMGGIMIFQSIFTYLGRGFHRYIASVFAGNCLMRAWIGGVFPVFATQMYHNLGSHEFPVGAGGSILGAISVLMIAIPFTFYKYGVGFRGRSKYAN